MTTQITPRQKEMIVFYQQKWKEIYLSTKPIDRNRVLHILKEVFKAHPEHCEMPEVIFFESPYAAFNAQLRVTTLNFNGMNSDEILNNVTSLMTLIGEGLIRDDLWFNLYRDISVDSAILSWENRQFLGIHLEDRVGSKIYDRIWELLWDWLFKKLQTNWKDIPEALCHFSNNFIDPNSEWASYAGLFDFYTHELDYSFDDREQLNLYQAMCSECSYWFLPSSRYYIVCDRPTKILLNNQGQLHGEEEPAIQFMDGFGLYAKHGEIYSVCFPKE